MVWIHLINHHPTTAITANKNRQLNFHIHYFIYKLHFPVEWFEELFVLFAVFYFLIMELIRQFTELPITVATKLFSLAKLQNSYYLAITFLIFTFLIYFSNQQIKSAKSTSTKVIILFKNT